MKAYFDTNVYRFIREKRETDAVRKVLQRCACELEASSLNLFETYAIKHPSERLAELEVIVSIADAFEARPVPWKQAIELHGELRRLRPSWMQAAPRTRNIRRFLHAHVERWHLAQLRQLPAAEEYAAYSRPAEAGIRGQGTIQRSLRQIGTCHDTLVQLVGPDGTPRPVDLANPEVYWRAEGMAVWYNAIVMKDPACRDYADWLGPYLKPQAFRDDSYGPFWLNEVLADSMPSNRLTGLVAYYQLRDRITHGNPADQLHACHWLSADVFFTADRAFHRALDQAACSHFQGGRRPILLDRSAHSCAAQLDEVLRTTFD